jgi:hypothetical protein
MNSSRHNAVAAEPRQFKAGTKACRVETRSAKTGSRLRERKIFTLAPTASRRALFALWRTVRGTDNLSALEFRL